MSTDPTTVARAIEQIQIRGSSRIGDVSVKVVNHPSMTGMVDTDKAHFAVEVTRAGNREIVDDVPMTLKDAQGVALVPVIDVVPELSEEEVCHHEPSLVSREAPERDG